ncbi:hypothetical protein QR680_014096 [Steinernema hermaphroditum]|uniref:Uncharacterized protein n=1 Tax=Steinernema hermaphroditum TaxID=289476 RepID=A0AA39M3M0_9BILA|nr:hypothetical protein QR680_014096 [Steinernema hermaphroditum]
MLPICGPNAEPLLDGHEVPYSKDGLYIGIFYLCVYLVLGIPQAMCLYALCHKKHLQYSCYKLMLMVSVLDMFNLTEGSLICGIFSIYNINHCNTGRIVLCFGEMIMVVWMVYCFTSMTLALNRLLEFVSRRASDVLFRGYRAWLWAIPAWGYALGMALSVPKPYYYYVPVKGELTFYRINEDNTKLIENTNHIVNNMAKGCTIALTYVAMLIVMRLQLKSSGIAMSKLEITLSIQAFFVGLMSVLSSVVYVLLEYLPVGDFSLIGPVGMLCWLSTHGVSGYIYLIMNKSIRQTAFGLFRLDNKVLFKKAFGPSLASVVPATNTRRNTNTATRGCITF